MKKNDIVRFKKEYNKKFLNDSMVNFIEQNKDTLFLVERVENDTENSSVKLRKIGFWVSKDLLELQG